VEPLASSPEVDSKVWETLLRGTVEIIGEEDLKRKLISGRPLRIKLGVDPTAPDIHLGFTVVMRKLRQFQDLGHQVVLIVGDYTATVGDPSGKNKTRPILSHADVLRNAETYKQQFFQIVDPARTEVVYNGDWFAKMTFTEVTELMAQITVAQMLEREDFKNRYEGGQPISLHEFLYPMMQAWDSVKIRADVELGGTDQKFNVLRGRELQRSIGQEAQVGLFLPILLGTDGREKMSKSLGNTIGVTEAPQSMYHKLYALPDAQVRSYFELLTDIPLAEIAADETAVTLGSLHPNARKEKLARLIVTQYHGAEAAEKAASEEKRIHSGEALPEIMPEIGVAAGEHGILELMTLGKLTKSNSEARRLVENGGVQFDGEKMVDPKVRVSITATHVLRAGKRSFLRILVAAVFLMALMGCAMLPWPMNAASPKKSVAKAIEKKLKDRDSIYVLPTWVEYERKGLLFSKQDSNVIRTIGGNADQILCEAIRSQLSKEPVLVSDPVEQSRIMGDSSLLYFQMKVDGFSRTPVRRILAETKSFVVLVASTTFIVTTGWNMTSPVNTSSDVRLFLRRGGAKTKVLFKQADQDDLNPADPSDLKWQVRKMLDPDYQGA
jgi:tyrosyl-tRNA synthetase